LKNNFPKIIGTIATPGKLCYILEKVCGLNLPTKAGGLARFHPLNGQKRKILSDIEEGKEVKITCLFTNYCIDSVTPYEIEKRHVSS
jgi:hypothetical protein